MAVMPPRSDKQENTYWELWLNERDPEAANQLIKIYEPIIQFQVKRMRMSVPKSVTTDELMSYAYAGLYDALLKFDAKRDLKFDTYASIRVKGAIIDGLRRDDPLPRTLRAKAKKIEKVIEELEQKLGREVHIDEIAESLGVSHEEVQKVLNESYFNGMTMSLDDAIDAENGYESIGSIIEDKRSTSPIDFLLKVESIDQLAEEIAKLTEKEQYVISLFYHEELTLSEIGRILGLSTSRVSQIHSKALGKLRERLEKNVVS
ncbi:MAG: FliA/WhiG family RNA polymerase sigma factor [Tuberibacillus sp.]